MVDAPSIFRPFDVVKVRGTQNYKQATPENRVSTVYEEAITSGASTENRVSTVYKETVTSGASTENRVSTVYLETIVAAPPFPGQIGQTPPQIFRPGSWPLVIHRPTLAFPYPGETVEPTYTIGQTPSPFFQPGSWPLVIHRPTLAFPPTLHARVSTVFGEAFTVGVPTARVSTTADDMDSPRSTTPCAAANFR